MGYHYFIKGTVIDGNKIGKTKTITLKNSFSSFDRYINIDESILGTSTTFGGNQLNSFTELNLSINKEKQNINIGITSFGVLTNAPLITLIV